MLVGSVADAATALGTNGPTRPRLAISRRRGSSPWPWTALAAQRIAFDAFTKAAGQQGILVAKPRSRAHDWLDAAAGP